MPDTKSWIISYSFLFMLLFPSFYTGYVFFIIYEHSPDRPIALLKRRLLVAFFVIQLISVLGGGALGIAIVWAYSPDAILDEGLQPTRILLMGILLIVLAPLNLFLAFLVKAIRKSITKASEEQLLKAFEE